MTKYKTISPSIKNDSVGFDRRRTYNQAPSLRQDVMGDGSSYSLGAAGVDWIIFAYCIKITDIPNRRYQNYIKIFQMYRKSKINYGKTVVKGNAETNVVKDHENSFLWVKRNK